MAASKMKRIGSVRLICCANWISIVKPQSEENSITNTIFEWWNSFVIVFVVFIPGLILKHVAPAFLVKDQVWPGLTRMNSVKYCWWCIHQKRIQNPVKHLWWSIFTKIALRQKCPYSKLFLSALLRISPYSVRIRENADQNNSEYGHFTHRVGNG